MNLKEMVQGMAGAYNSLLDYLKVKRHDELNTKSCIIWMEDEEGLHVIDTQDMLDAMNAFLTVLETKDKIVKTKDNNEEKLESGADSAESA